MSAPSIVWFTDLRGDQKSSLLDRIDTMLTRSRLDQAELDRRLVALKIHFGEKGNTAFVRPMYAARIAAFFLARNAKPFLTDTNTLYVGSRAESVSHHLTAVEHGFDPAVTGAPVIIAGGLRGTSAVAVPVNGKHFSKVEIAPELIEADVVVGITHFKGHEMSGFGGTIKNFGMGGAARSGKLAMHSRVNPVIHTDSCTGCRLCGRWCAQEAIVYAEGKAVISPERCVGCGACLPTCPVGAIRIVWNEQTADMQEKMAEYAWGCLKEHLDGRSLFFNFVTQVSPMCDCYPFAGAPIVPDIGVLASHDPVAVDQASADLVKASAGSTALPERDRAPGRDKFRSVHPKVDWERQLDHAASLGLGSREYRLERI
jgi:uncharacterized Fe-S center protein